MLNIANPKNRFAQAEGVASLIHQVVGAGSMCWPEVKGVFQDDKARKVAEEALERLFEIQAKQFIDEMMGYYTGKSS